MDSRLNNLFNSEKNRIDSRFNDLVDSEKNARATPTTTSAADGNTAPVFLLRDAATDAGVHSPDNQIHSHSDVISTGLVSLPTAHLLLEL